MKKLSFLLAVFVVASLVLTACGGGGSDAADLLADIKARGYILVSTDPNYAPNSFLNTDGKRPADSLCPSDALTTAEMQGFDVDVAKAIGSGLGVETCFATPAWEAITAGTWSGQWDISVGSMTIQTARLEVLDFAVPYYYTPAVVAFSTASGITSLDGLAGQTVCAAISTTYELWLNHADVGIPASSIYASPPENVTVVTFDTDQECAQAIQAGRTEFVAYVTSATVVDANIAAGIPVVKLDSPVFSEDLAVALDKSSPLGGASLLAEINKIITGMHSDGTLSALSLQWFELDLTQAPK